jgi:hypothetical protein
MHHEMLVARRTAAFVLAVLAGLAVVLIGIAPSARAAPVDFFTINDVSLNEGNGGTTNLTFTIQYTGPLNDISVNWATADNTAVAPADYVAASGVATFTAASGTRSRTITVAVAGDLLDENAESFYVNLTNPQPSATAAINDAQGIGTINDNDPNPTVSIGDVMVAEGTGGTTNAVFTLSLSTASGRSLSVRAATANGTATQPGDYASRNQILTFPVGTTTQTFSVPIVTDSTDEVDETFVVNLSNATNVTIADGQAAGAITDDDGPPSVSINDVSFTEGNSGTSNLTFTLTLSAASGKVITVDYATADGTATAPSEYQTRTGTVTFTAGQTSRPFTVPVVGDTLDELDETFVANLSNATNATIADAQGVATILDNDATPSLRVNDIAVIEGDASSVSAGFAITLSAASGKTVSVAVGTSNVTATAAADYDAVSTTVTFTPGQTTRPLPVNVLGDLLDEANETYNVNLTSPTNATIADALGVGTITDNDPTPSFSIDDVTIAEGDSGTTNAVFTVTLSAPSGRTTGVRAQAANGAATSPGDYSATTVNLSFPAGTTSLPVAVPIVGDALDEADEGFVVNLSNVTNATIADTQGSGTIIDDDALPALSVADVSRTEGDAGTANLTFTVSLAPVSGRTVTVAYATADDTALAPADYQSRSGTLTFTAGQTARTFTVPVVGDTLDELDESFLVSLSSPTNATIADDQAVGGISDDDAPPALSVDDITSTEGDAGTSTSVFTVSLSAPSGKTVTVDHSTSDGTAHDGPDYGAVAGTLTFAPGDVSKTVDVEVAGDLLDEFDETFTLDLANESNAAVADGSGLGTIVDDDLTPTVSVGDVTLAEGDLGTATASLAVTLSAPSGKPVSVDVATSDGTAVDGEDYVAVHTTVSFAEGESSATVDVAVTGDVTYEDDETFSATLSNLVNVDPGTGSATVTITNDDPIPTVTIADAADDEGDGGSHPLVFAVDLSNPSAFPISMDVTSADDTATAPQDYGSVDDDVAFAPGSTNASVEVTVSGDVAFERDETFAVDLAGASGATIGDGSAVGTIRNDDEAPVIEVEDVAVLEGDDGPVLAEFTLSLAGATTLPVTVDVATTDVSAISPTDYEGVSTGVTFPAGETSRTVSVEVHGDELFEGDETFVLELSNAVDADLDSAVATGTILNDDPLPAVFAGDATVVEGDTDTNATVRLSLDSPSAYPIHVDVWTEDGTATSPADFEPVETTITIAPDTTTALVQIPIHGDADIESDETFSVHLEDVRGATIGGDEGEVTIRDDDALLATRLHVRGRGLRDSGAAVRGRLVGGDASMDVRLVLLVRRGDAWVEVSRKVVPLTEGPGAPRFRTTFPNAGPGPSLVRAFYDGDSQHHASQARDRFRI